MIQKQKLRPVKITKLNLLHIVATALVVCGALVSTLAGTSGVLHLRKDAEPSRGYITDNGGVSAFGFDLSLKEFTLERYEGSDKPKTFACTVDCDGQLEEIRINHPLKKHFRRFYLLSYDPDLEGCSIEALYDPWGMGLVYAGYALFVLFALILLAERLGNKILPLLAIWLTTAALIDIIVKRSEVVPALQSGLFGPHVAAVGWSYLLLLATAVASIVHLCRGKGPSEALRSIHVIGTVLMGVGIILGSIWGGLAWGRYWGWDPKETWSLVTFVTYSLPLHVKRLQEGKPMLIWLAAAFLCVLITFVGVNFFASGLHSYL